MRIYFRNTGNFFRNFYLYLFYDETFGRFLPVCARERTNDWCFLYVTNVLSQVLIPICGFANSSLRPLALGRTKLKSSESFSITFRLFKIAFFSIFCSSERNFSDFAFQVFKKNFAFQVFRCSAFQASNFRHIGSDAYCSFGWLLSVQVFRRCHAS